MSIPVNDLPDNIPGAAAEGKVPGIGFESGMLPVIENSLKDNLEMRISHYPGSGFTGFDLSAMLDDF